MNITINKIKHKIKPASELTVKEYSLFIKQKESSTSNFQDLMNYLSICLGIEFMDVSGANISDKSLIHLISYIGTIKPFNELGTSKTFYYEKFNKTIYRNEINWRTLGVRKLLEEKKLETQIEQAVYLLAIYIQEDYDAEKIEEIYNDLQNYNAIQVFSFIVFFYQNLSNGQKLGINYLKILWIKVKISIRKLLNK